MLPFIKFNNKDGQNNGVHSIKFRYPKIENIQYNVNIYTQKLTTIRFLSLQIK